VTVAVVFLSFLTWAALRAAHADVAATGRRIDEDEDSEDALILVSLSAMRKVSVV
jgi:hypothetical protein